MTEIIDYWILDDIIIFKPKFNNVLDDYVEIISKYDKLIFSNYDCPKICTHTNNDYNSNYINW